MSAAPAARSPVALQLKRGGDAFIVAHEGDHVVLASTAPSPPGSTVEASYSADVRSVSVRVKVRGCRRESLPDGRDGFRIDGRFVSLTRSDRELLFPSQSGADPESTSET